MTVPPEKKRRLTDDWGDDDDFDQILTQHGNLEQIDNLVESSQQVLTITTKSFTNEIKCKEVVRTKNHFYQRHNSFGSPVTYHQKQQDFEKDKEIEQQMFTKDGEIKNLKIRLAALQKDLYLQKVEASEEKKKLAANYEEEKESLNKEIAKLKTDIEFKDHELKKHKYASPCSQSVTNKPSINFSSSPNNTNNNNMRNSLSKKPFKSPNQYGFQLSDTFSKVLSKNQESQTSSMGVETKNILKPYKLSSKSTLNTFPMATIINLKNLHNSLELTQLSKDLKEDLNDRSLMTLLGNLNSNHINELHNKNSKNNFSKTYNDQLLVLTESLRDRSDKVISCMSQSRLTPQSDFAQLPLIYSDFQNHFFEMVYKTNIGNKAKEASNCDMQQNNKLKCDRYSICDTQKTSTSSNVSESSFKIDSSNMAESKNSYEIPIVSFSRDLNVLKNILIFFKELNIDLNSRCVESICSLVMKYPTCKESFYNNEVLLPVIDIISVLASSSFFHPHLRNLFKDSLLLNILKSYNTDSNYNDSNESSGSDNICFFVDLERGIKECLWYRLAKLLESVSKEDELFDMLCSRSNESCLISCLCDMCHHIRSNHPCIYSCMIDRVFLKITANILTRVTTSSSSSSSSSSITPSPLRMQDCQCFYKLSKEIFSIIENNIDKFLEIRHKTCDIAQNETKKYQLIADQISNDLADQTGATSLKNMNTTPRLLFTNAVHAELLLQNFTALQSVSAHFKKEFTTSLLMNIGVMQSFKTFLSTHSSFLTEHQYSELLDVVTCHLNHVNPDEIGLIDE